MHLRRVLIFIRLSSGFLVGFLAQKTLRKKFRFCDKLEKLNLFKKLHTITFKGFTLKLV
jgi:hypothetical protein